MNDICQDCRMKDNCFAYQSASLIVECGIKEVEMMTDVWCDSAGCHWNNKLFCMRDRIQLQANHQCHDFRWRVK